MRYRKGKLFMNVHLSKKAELFHKAIEDIWVAEQVWEVTPNNAVWHCTQAVEKTMKGFLRCLNKEYEYGHELKALLDVVEPLMDAEPETIKNILYLNGFGVSLRYKHISSDPTIEEAKIVITRAKHIMQAFRDNINTSNFMKEAQEVHTKILQSISR